MRTGGFQLDRLVQRLAALHRAVGQMKRRIAGGGTWYRLAEDPIAHQLTGLEYPARIDGLTQTGLPTSATETAPQGSQCPRLNVRNLPSAGPRERFAPVDAPIAS